MNSFVRAVLSSVSWRAVLLTQTLGVLFALTPWLEQGQQRPSDYLAFNLVQQAAAAGFLMLAAFVGDEAVRRGWTVWRAFTVVLLGASAATALVDWVITLLVQFNDPHRGLVRTATDFFNLGSLWGTVLLVYLNRQSAARLLASVRGGDLERARAERRLIESDVAAVEVQMDPAAVSRQLQALRDLYAADDPDAESRMEALINDLREKVARCAPLS